MRISVSTRHGHLAAETQEKISQKIGKLSRIYDRVSSASVTIDLQEGGEPKVEVNLAVDGAPDFVSHTRGANLLGAVDGAVHKLEQQLRRHKEKIIDQHRERRRLADSNSTLFVEPEDDLGDDESGMEED